jgi:hypothetical protein
MAKHIVFTDGQVPEQKLRSYVNEDGRLYMEIGRIYDADDYYTGWATFDKEDVSDLIKELKRLIKLME